MAKSTVPASKRLKPPAPLRAAQTVRASGARPPTFATFDDALTYLYERVDLERARPTSATRHQYKLDRMRAILEALDNPHAGVRHVHIGGTKGKGSTCEMLATCLESCGYTVGLYTSPHLVSVRERVRLNRRFIDEADFTRLMQTCAKAAASVQKAHGDATFFELTTAMAFLHFAEQAVDIAVIEVGLGGLLDCTNVITPEVAAVTMIGLDHTQILGDTHEEIAVQKAGIFKPGVAALTYEQNPEVAAVLRRCAEAAGSPFHVLGRDIDFTFRAEGTPTGLAMRCSLTSERNTYEHITAPLRGEHQAWNCGLALAILDQLCARGFNCPVSKVTRGMELVRLPGRFELAPGPVRLLLDGAHNTESMSALVKSISQNLRYDSLVVVFGCAADKDAGAMLRCLAMGADKVICTRAAGNARAADPHDLARAYHEITGRTAQHTRTLAEALDLATRAAGRDDLVCVTGSFYLVGEAKKAMATRAATARPR